MSADGAGFVSDHAADKCSAAMPQDRTVVHPRSNDGLPLITVRHQNLLSRPIFCCGTPLPVGAWERKDEPVMSRENAVFAAATFTGVALLFTFGLSGPGLFVEDGLVENLSALGFAVAALFALSAALLGPASTTFAERSILFGVSGLSLVLFLSEISFGARIFHIQMPRMSGGGEFDGGHDVVILIIRHLRDAGHVEMLVAVIGGGLFLAAIFVLLRRFQRQAGMIVRHVLSKAFEFRLVVALGMLASAVILDVIPSYKASILEEVLEFSAGVVLAMAVLALFLPKGVMAGFGKILGREVHIRTAHSTTADHRSRR
jgi:hypothetical protein